MREGLIREVGTNKTVRDNARDPLTKLVPLSIMWKIRSQGHCYGGRGGDRLINEVTNLALTRFTYVFLCEFFLG